MMYLDYDTTPPVRSRYLACKRLEVAQKAAFAQLNEVTEGQVGIYDNHVGAGFKGYAIKYPGQTPYFEAAPA